MDISSLGDEVSHDTVLCEGMLMHNDISTLDSFNPPGGDPATLTFLEQNELQQFITDSFGEESTALPCEQDFEENMVVTAFYYTVTHNCSTVDICGVYESEEKINVPVFFYHCDNGTQDVTAAFHLVITGKSEKEIEYVVHTKQYGEADW